jgi:DNA polymerase-3 subunit gamma/tau
MLTGVRGVGKTTTARIIARALNCVGPDGAGSITPEPCGVCDQCQAIAADRHVDVIEMDAASRTGVDDIRELIDGVRYRPVMARYKVYIIDEVHMLSTPSFNALLKTLEEPPPHVKFVLATTDPQKIPLTILSRCLRFNLRRLLPDQIGGYLKTLVENEEIEAEPETIRTLSRAADGSMRDGLSLLDQAIAFGGGKLVMSDLEKMLGLVDHLHVVSMIRALSSNDAQGLLSIVEDLVSQSRDLETVLLNLAEVLHRITLVQCVPGYRDPERSDWDAIEELAELLPVEDAQLFYQIAIKGRAELGLAPDPRTGLEMTLLRMLAFRPVPVDSTASPGEPSQGVTPGKSPKASPRSAPAPAPASASAPTATKPLPKAKPVKAQAPEPARPETTTPASSDWVTLLSELKLSGQARELARNVQLKTRSDDHWDFVIAPSLRYLRSDSCVSSLSQAISDQLGHQVNVRIVDEESTEIRTAAAIEEQKVRESMSEAEKAINDDPTVKALKEQMGAQLVEDSIQPLQ